MLVIAGARKSGTDMGSLRSGASRSRLRDPINKVKDRTAWGTMGVDDVSVAELFAGVGGFRLGLEYKGVARKWPRPRVDGFEVIWSNQWEPDEVTKKDEGKQWASKIYTKWFGSEGHEGGDIHEFTKTVEATQQIPDIDMLVGGFPCQDYSVARTISGEMGIHGEKGKLWEPIWRIIGRSHKRKTSKRPKLILLENVPRLLNSPASSRGLNFAIILKRLIGFGYDVEWRVINASDYGMPQQRKRVFILAYRTQGHGGERKGILGEEHFGLNGQNRKTRNPMERWMFGDSDVDHEDDWEVGPFAMAFPSEPDSYKRKELKMDGFSNKSSDFGNAGYAWEGWMGNRRWVKQFCSWNTTASYEGRKRFLGDVLVKEHAPSYEVSEDRRAEWDYVKGARKEWRIRKRDRENVGEELWAIYEDCMASMDQDKWDRHEGRFTELEGEDGPYRYVEGAIANPDRLDKASRTVVTAEIGSSPSRMRHIIEQDGVRRRLMPIELERLNQFPDNWTRIDGIADSKRGFLMGNALVVGVIDRLREPLLDRIS